MPQSANDRSKEKVKLDLSEFNPKRNFSVPNVISLIRLAIIPFMVWFYLEGKLVWAVAMVAISGLSDAIDGYIARHFNQITPLGKVLDPVADKLTQIALGVCLVFSFPFVLPLVILLVIKDALMLFWGVRLLKAGQSPFSARWWGKVATIAFYIGVLVIMAFDDKMGITGVFVVSAVIFLLMSYSLLRYGIVFRDKIQQASSDTTTNVA